MLKSLTLVSILFIGVLLGMQYASNGILEMKGLKESSFQTPVQIQQNESGNIEASILGNEIKKETIAEKKEKLEEMKAFNFFSSIGKNLANFVSTSTKSLVEWISTLI